jgi:hypothetical protein
MGDFAKGRQFQDLDAGREAQAMGVVGAGGEKDGSQRSDRSDGRRDGKVASGVPESQSIV